MPKLKNILLQLSLILFFMIFVIAIRFEPMTKTFQFDYDEGFNLMKAVLYSKGFSLYSQIWNDQPPLFTAILSQWLNSFGHSIFSARLLTLLFSAILIWCFYQIVFFELGHFAAIVATFFVFTSWLYIRLSISVMIGIPSLALAMLSIYFLYRYQQKYNKFYLILSGGCLALSLQTKLFTIFLIPLILLQILAFCSQSKEIKTNRLFLLQSISLWLISLVFVYSLVGILYQQFWNQEQLLLTHLKQTPDSRVENFNNLQYLNYMIHQDYDYIFLAGIGIWAIISQKQKKGLLPLTWLITATLILLKHQPLWYHYYPLLAIPICWLAAYGACLLYNLFSQNIQKNFQIINIKKLILPASLVVILISLIIITPPNPRGSVPKNLELMQMILKYKSLTNWVFTDNPMYAFYNDLIVPPEIAVMSYKRINSGDFTFTKMLAILNKYHPEQIIFTRWTTQIKSDKNMINYINNNYSLTYTNATKTEEHYVLK
ncbi:glycosyltransferase family 39 protein [Fischerella thermalis]|uniref:glycosyltransferase family 39 protein n=1 Tax=Fischerella thermalis TaxID=372787 RepID=UPI000C8085A0|nr:glycosyltransferase family 39 protein [Fischerella thermalis]PLZ14878.1 glycosyl transferase family 39 [Fischerella thermalis WC114]PLZ15274.1 glycosyl transferase family 39 [Fischerella thermalis WC119]PLZ28835.1 glycosyl transferase family 39 [Fischerella thermalis WC558]PLZ32919.1 glycosyl transferase family 39 [Fischerella thermalis WC542]PLZ48929.1 glycosyl transferase family 39 [Fischerella thermalis WC441]PLZ64468.1 glycosyl transferase family 39 [Fischerella thermalis WC249]PLZ760